MNFKSLSELLLRVLGYVQSALPSLFSIGIIVGLLVAVTAFVPELFKPEVNTAMSLPLLVVIGVIALLLVLALISVTFGLLSLADRTQALALPEGSIRAVLALALVLIFSILSVFLFDSLNRPGDPLSTHWLTESEKSEFFLRNPTARSIEIVEHKIQIDNADQTRFEINYRMPPSQDSADLAKQLLTMVGTLMTTVAGFYFGSQGGSRSTGYSQGSQVGSSLNSASNPPPIVRRINPTQVHLDTPMALKLELLGENLGSTIAVSIVSAGKQVSATEVATTSTSVNCVVALDASTTPPASWDIVVVSGSGQSSVVAGGLSII